MTRHMTRVLWIFFGSRKVLISLFQSLGCWMGHFLCPECFSLSSSIIYSLLQLLCSIFKWTHFKYHFLRESFLDAQSKLGRISDFSFNRSQLFFIPYLFTIYYIFLLFKNWMFKILCFKKPGTIFILFNIVNTVLAYEVPRIIGTHWVFVEEMNVWLQCPYT